MFKEFLENHKTAIIVGAAFGTLAGLSAKYAARNTNSASAAMIKDLEARQKNTTE